MPATASKGQVIHDLNALRVEQAQALEAADKILKLAEADNDRDLTPEESAEWEGYMGRAEELGQQYEEELKQDKKAAMNAALKDSLQRFDAIPTPQDVLTKGAVSRVINLAERWEKDPKRGFAGLGDFATAVYGAALDSRIDDRLMRIEAAMTVGSGPDGGWLMPPEFSQTIWNELSMTQVNLIAMADVYPVNGESLTLLANGETSRATGSRWGGVRAYWVEDGEVKTESNPRIRRLKLEPHPLAVLVRVDNTLMKNQAAVERLLNQAAPDEIIFTVNDAIIRGDGVAKPLGILNSTALVTVAAEGGQVADTLNKTNIDKMWARLHIRSRLNARWFINQNVDVQLEALSMGGTANTVAIFMPSVDGSPSITATPNRMLKGRPILEIEQASTLGDVGDVLLADMKAYAIGVRGMSRNGTDPASAIESDMSIHLWFDRNQTAFRFVFYVDGQPWLTDPLTPYQGTDSTSPFVALAAR